MILSITDSIINSDIDLVIIRSVFVFFIGLVFILKSKFSLEMLGILAPAAGNRALSFDIKSSDNEKKKINKYQRLNLTKYNTEYTREDLISSSEERYLSNRATRRILPFIKFSGLVLMILSIIIIISSILIKYNI